MCVCAFLLPFLLDTVVTVKHFKDSLLHMHPCSMVYLISSIACNLFLRIVFNIMNINLNSYLEKLS